MQWRDYDDWHTLSSTEGTFLARLYLPRHLHERWRVSVRTINEYAYLDAALTLEEAKAVVQVLAASQL